MTKKSSKKFKINSNKAKKQPQAQEFPRIYRIITEWGKFRLVLPSYRFLVYFFSVLLSLGILVSGYVLYTTIREKQHADEERLQVLKEIRYWEEITGKYIGYRDAYLQLAVLQYQLGEFDRARYFAQKGFAIDPNSQEVGDMLRLLK